MPDNVIPSATAASPRPRPSLSHASPSAAPRPWATDREALKKWFRIFLVAWLGGGAILIVGLSTDITPILYVGFAGFIGSIIPYVKSLQYSYGVQSKLNAAKLYAPGAWQVVVGGIMLNPFVVGFLIPLSVLGTVKKIDRNLDQGR
jgi:hypothetical protein